MYFGCAHKITVLQLNLLQPDTKKLLPALQTFEVSENHTENIILQHHSDAENMYFCRVRVRKLPSIV
jgi:hypothetical protein